MNLRLVYYRNKSNIRNPDPDVIVESIQDHVPCETTMDVLVDNSPNSVSEMIQAESNNSVTITGVEKNTDSSMTNSVNKVYSEPSLRQFVDVKLNDNEDWKNVEVLSRAGKVNGKYGSWYNIRDT